MHKTLPDSPPTNIALANEAIFLIGCMLCNHARYEIRDCSGVPRVILRNDVVGPRQIRSDIRRLGEDTAAQLDEQRSIQRICGKVEITPVQTPKVRHKS